MKLRNLGVLALLYAATVLPAFASTTVSASETESPSLVTFPPSTDPVVELGDRHGCVFYPDDGNVNCFSIHRQYLAYPSTVVDYLEGDAIDFRANDYTNCVLKLDGTTYCWGLYAVGDPSTDLTWGDEEVLAHGKAVALEVGYGEACILTESNSLFCNGSYTSGLNQPNSWNLVASGDLEFMVMGSYQVCYKKASETTTLRCRGFRVSEPVWNIEGKNGAPGVPMPAGGGHYFLCVLVQDGAVDCMNNLYHESGNSLLPPADDTIDAVDVDGKDALTCAVGLLGVLRCYGQLNGVNNKTFELATDAVSVSVGAEDVCWVTVAGDAKCWKSTPDAYDPPVSDTDGDGIPDDQDAFPSDPTEWADLDLDTIGDNGDFCDAPSTDASIALNGLNPNHWKLSSDGFRFEQGKPKGKGKGSSGYYDLATTGGCTCEQIIDKLQLGEGHKKHGCSNSAMSDWAAIVAGGAGKGNTSDFETDMGEQPTEVVLEGNYPNPFNPQTTIRFGLLEASEVSLVVYDLMGREVQVLVRGTLSAGMHSATFDASSLPSGAYMYRLATPGQEMSKLMMLLK